MLSYHRQNKRTEVLVHLERVTYTVGMDGKHKERWAFGSEETMNQKGNLKRHLLWGRRTRVEDWEGQRLSIMRLL